MCSSCGCQSQATVRIIRPVILIEETKPSWNVEDLLPLVKKKDGHEDFDYKKIIKSLRKETDLTEEQINKIVKKLLQHIISWKIYFLTSPEVRELICAFMIHHGFIKQRFQYTRIGMPLYEFKQVYENKELSEYKKRAILFKQTEQEYLDICKIIENLEELKDG